MSHVLTPSIYKTVPLCPVPSLLATEHWTVCWIRSQDHNLCEGTNGLKENRLEFYQPAPRFCTEVKELMDVL